MKLGEKEYETLRITKWSENELAEVYVDGKTGLTVLFRRYNGPGWDNHEELSSSPGREIEGIHFRLWYDSIPVRDEEVMKGVLKLLHLNYPPLRSSKDGGGVHLLNQGWWK